MSVIAKLMVRAQSEFGTGRLIELSCVCDNDLMAAYATSEEDKLFTRYSPSGDMRLHQPSSYVLSGEVEPADQDPNFPKPPAAFYVMVLAEDEHELVEDPRANSWEDKNFPGAAAWRLAGCHSLSQYGGDTARVEFRAGGQGHGRGVDALNWKMSVDNPAASSQFKPGARYFIVLYDAARHTRDTAIAAAHGRA